MDGYTIIVYKRTRVHIISMILQVFSFLPLSDILYICIRIYSPYNPRERFSLKYNPTFARQLLNFIPRYISAVYMFAADLIKPRETTSGDLRLRNDTTMPMQDRDVKPHRESKIHGHYFIAGQLGANKFPIARRRKHIVTRDVTMGIMRIRPRSTRRLEG